MILQVQEWPALQWIVSALEVIPTNITVEITLYITHIILTQTHPYISSFSIAYINTLLQHVCVCVLRIVIYAMSQSEWNRFNGKSPMYTYHTLLFKIFSLRIVATMILFSSYRFKGCTTPLTLHPLLCHL